MKNKLILFGIILLVLPLVFAGNYGVGIYGKGLYGLGEVTPNATPPNSVNRGGGSGCSYDWQCTGWFPSICPESKIQKRICVNQGDCTGTTGMPNQTQTCEYLGPTEPLFDIYLTLPDNSEEVCAGDSIKANVKLENYAKVELLDAFMKYWIINKNNTLIAESKDTRAVEKETNFNIELKIPNSTVEGTYRLYSEIRYNGNKTAVTGKSFEVLPKKDCASKLPQPSPQNFNFMYLIYGVIGILAILFILIKLFKTKFRIIKKRHRKLKNYFEYKNKTKKNQKRIKSKHFWIVIFGLMFAGLLFIVRNNLIRFAIGTTSKINNWNSFRFILILGILGFLIFIFKKKLLEKIEIRRRNRHPKNSIKGLIKKKVYSEEGDYIGKVKEVLLGKNKIDSLKIKLDKRCGKKIKGIIINYKDVKSTGHIVIVDKRVLEN